ncbi:AAA family ATPase [Brevibacillus ruminantium]|uniref:AAA family ATPase n=1 Tax=Brevibacillus ruminantium TaxID=2950604 RepID=A0ABY4WLS5_9BACL|nr:AAA family ATPase [Brevibacillus ruminantium]USG68105.1 AAA family ATPase [Brevibacillus ruminantium]
MQHQQVPDQFEKMKGWREKLPDPAAVTEEELFTLLRLIEERGKPGSEGGIEKAGEDAIAKAGDAKAETGEEVGTEAEEGSKVEAVVLTLLAAKRMEKPDGFHLADEWLTRAAFLDPAFLPAHEWRMRLQMQRLKQHTFSQRYPLIRETDNAVSRRKNLETLQEAGAAELEELADWIKLAAEARVSAEKAGAFTFVQKLAHLEALYQQRENLLRQMLEKAEEYASSLHGMFFSVESLTALQDAIRALTAQHEEKQQLFAEDSSDSQEEPKQPETALAELESLIGMREIKERVRSLARFLRYRQLREQKGWKMRDQLPLHLVFMGNPGTGKTTLARLLARLYHELGLLARGEIVEVDRSHLVGAYVGQTEQKVMEAVKRAEGGVLFIDEAYSLKRSDSSGADYGQAAIDTLVAAMTGGEYAGKFVVMLAGYPEEMRQFLFANPGLRSRFPETGHFLLPDYSADELLQIAEKVASRNDYALTEETRRALRKRIEDAQVDDTFGNARTVHNIVMDAIFAKGRELGEKELKWQDFTLLDPADVLPAQPESKSGSARRQLENLIGLAQVKEELAKITSFVTVQRKRNEAGLPTVPIELHAVFTGNPGTGKTTVARLYAAMLKEIGYLKRGHLVTVGRADLVAGYVGQTATVTRRKVREALGGVLFIDEAYALAEGSESDFGQEAIHTLVEEMTRHQENLVVVLAGYPAEMLRFMESNPGLYSRFKKYIPFPDYTPEELVQMLLQRVEDSGYSIRPETVVLLRERLEQAALAIGLHGNGRFVTNLLQEAMQNQAMRLTMTESAEWTREELVSLEWSDFSPLFAGMDESSERTE